MAPPRARRPRARRHHRSRESAWPLAYARMARGRQDIRRSEASARPRGEDLSVIGVAQVRAFQLQRDPPPRPRPSRPPKRVRSSDVRTRLRCLDLDGDGFRARAGHGDEVGEPPFDRATPSMAACALENEDGPILLTQGSSDLSAPVSTDDMLISSKCHAATSESRASQHAARGESARVEGSVHPTPSVGMRRSTG